MLSYVERLVHDSQRSVCFVNDEAHLRAKASTHKVRKAKQRSAFRRAKRLATKVMIRNRYNRVRSHSRLWVSFTEEYKRIIIETCIYHLSSARGYLTN